MKKNISIDMDNWDRCLLYGVIARAILNDKALAPADIDKLEQMKTKLQDCTIAANAGSKCRAV